MLRWIVFPACAGMFRKILGLRVQKIAFSPRARGCSAGQGVDWRQSHVFPACAGMFPVAVPTRCPTMCFPRVRGDVPDNVITSPINVTFSPRARGCSS